jgi:TonB-dependent receptor
MGDPEHFSGQGSGVAVRGLTQVRAELNGRDIFSAADGRGLSFEDVPAELMAGVDVYKSPSADMIEGGLGGTVNLRTRMPFDQEGQLAGITIKGNYGDQIKELNGEYSAIYSNRWDTDAGEFGFLVDFSTSELSSRADNVYTRAYLPRTDVEAGKTVYIPKGADWRRNDYSRSRDGQYAAFQWAPNDTLQIYATAFSSKYDSQWNENGFFIDQYAGRWAPVPTAAKDWVYDANGALVSGTVTTADSKNGISFGTSTRLSHSITKTTDYSAGAKWTPDDHWVISLDLQRVESDASKEDYTLGLIVFPKEVSYSNLNSTPSIKVDPFYLADYRNYSYGQMMTLPGLNDAEQDAAKLDVEYKFEDSIIKSVKAGVRFTDKTAVTRSAASDTWKANYQPWQVGDETWNAFHNAEEFPKISQPLAAMTLTSKTFNNFQRGNVDVPVTAMMYQSGLLNDFKSTAEFLTKNSPGGCCGFDWKLVDVNTNANPQTEKTSSAFVMTSFGFDDLAMPVDGNLGVRFVKTENTAHGRLVRPGMELPDDPATTVVEKDYFERFETTDYDAKNSYNHVLPSLNVRLKATEDIFLRFSASKAIWAPNFSDLAAKIEAKPEWYADATHNRNPQESQFIRKLTMDTNPYLEPMQANQFDLSAEWYFDEHGGSAHVAFFKKDVSDFFRVANGTTVADFDGKSYVTKRLENTGTADIKGFEIGASKFFDQLPAPFDGLGMEANYTFIDSTTHVPYSTAPLDTDNTTYDTLPMEGLSKNAFNIIGMYEKDGISARLAYNWRSKYLVAVGPNGWNGNDSGVAWRLPVYNDNYGQLDASIGYTFLDNYTVTLEASNVTKEVTKGIIDQNKAGDHTAYVYSQDVRYAVSLRAKF